MHTGSVRYIDDGTAIRSVHVFDSSGAFEGTHAALHELDTISPALSNVLDATERSIGSAPRFMPEEAFRERIPTGDVIVHALASDPLPPPALHPEPWPAVRLRKVFGVWNRVVS